MTLGFGKGEGEVVLWAEPEEGTGADKTAEDEGRGRKIGLSVSVGSLVLYVAWWTT